MTGRFWWQTRLLQCSSAGAKVPLCRVQDGPPSGVGPASVLPRGAAELQTHSEQELVLWGEEPQPGNAALGQVPLALH